MKATVDRTFEDCADSEIVVTLSCGFRVRFWAAGLTDKEYIQRAKQIKKLEEKSQ